MKGDPCAASNFVVTLYFWRVHFSILRLRSNLHFSFLNETDCAASAQNNPLLVLVGECLESDVSAGIQVRLLREQVWL
jgi:hypothetical protein